MERSQYEIKIYQSGVSLWYQNYKSAYKRCQQLIARGFDCGIYVDGKQIISC